MRKLLSLLLILTLSLLIVSLLPDAQAQTLPQAGYNILLIYDNDQDTALCFQDFLVSAGHSVQIVAQSELNTVNYSLYNRILIGYDTGWDNASAAPVANTGLPIIGLGNGGYHFFGAIGLGLGVGQYFDSLTDMVVVNPLHSLYWQPAVISVPPSGLLTLYNASSGKAIYVSNPANSPVFIIGRSSQYSNYYPIAQQGTRFLLWGYNGIPTAMTNTGKSLFLNALRLPITTLGATATPTRTRTPTPTLTPSPIPPGTIRGQMVAAERAELDLLTGVRGYVRIFDPTYRPIAPVSVETDANGFFTFTRLAEGSYLLEGYPSPLLPTSYAPTELLPVTLRSGDSQTGLILRSNATQLQGSVRAPDGTLTGAVIKVYNQNNTVARQVYTYLGNLTGFYRLGGLPAGTYRMSARPLEGSPYGESALQTVTLGSGSVQTINFILTQVSIAGQVRAPDGNGVPYAIVNYRSAANVTRTATPMPTTPTPTAIPLDSLETGQTAFVPGEMPTTSATPGSTLNGNVTTDASGYFTITRLPPGNYWLQAKAPASSTVPYGPSPLLSVTISETTTVQTVLTLTRPSLFGNVALPTGEPAANARLILRGQETTSNFYQETSSNTEGQFFFYNIPPGDYLLGANPPWGNGGLLSPPPREVTIVANETTAAGLIAFQPANQWITGRVVKNTGGPASNAIVYAVRDDGSASAYAMVNPTSTLNYLLGLNQGIWLVSVIPVPGSNPDWIYTDPPRPVDLSAPTTVAVVHQEHFTVTTATSLITGQLARPNTTSVDTSTTEIFPPNSVFVSARDASGKGNTVAADTLGRFSLRVPAGTYLLSVYSREERLAAPSGLNVTIGNNQTRNVGTITLLWKTSRIVGQVTDGEGNPIPNVSIQAVRQGGTADTQIERTVTNDEGSFGLWVLPGRWLVSATPDPASGLIPPRRPTEVLVGPGVTVTLPIVLQYANVTLSGILLDQDSGRAVTDTFGFVLIFDASGQTQSLADTDATDPSPGGVVAGTPLENGHFTLDLPAGIYTVTTILAPGAPYTVIEDKRLDLTNSNFEEVPILVVRHNARIIGQLRLADGTPLIGVNAQVLADGANRGHRTAQVNPANGLYTLTVPAGTWYLNARIEPGQPYLIQPRQPNAITVGPGESATYDFLAVRINARILGTVTGPNGEPLAGIWVFAEEVARAAGAPATFGDKTNDEGHYQINLPAGLYRVGARAPTERGLIPPSPGIVMAPAETETTVNLTFYATDAEIRGTVTLSDTPHSAFVWGFSDQGGATWTRAGDGTFTLPVHTGQTWIIGAMTKEGNLLWRAAPVTLTIDSPEVIRNLALTTALPLPRAQIVQFDASQAQVIRLDDDTELQIPAGALALTGTVTVRITPTDERARLRGMTPIGIAYNIDAFDADGQPITQLRRPATLIFHYTDEELTAAGLTEDNLVAGFWDPLSGTWQHLDNTILDPIANTITVLVDHFTEFEEMGIGSSLVIYLPIVISGFTG